MSLLDCEKQDLMSKLYRCSQISLIFFFIFPMFLSGGNINGYLSTSAYTFTRRNMENSSVLHIRMYQSIWLQGSNLLIKKSRLNLSGIFYLDPLNSFDNEPIFQIYSFNYSTDWFSKKLKIKIGRQFQYIVSDAGRFDGFSTNYNHKEFTFKSFIGSYIPATGITDHPLKNKFWGGEIRWHKYKTLDIRMGFSDKTYGRPVYRSIKLNKDIKVPASFKRRVGLQIRLQSRNLSFFVRSRYRTVNFNLTDFTVQTEFKGLGNTLLKNLIFSYYLREPRIPDNSIFSVFNTYSSQEISLSGRLSLFKKLTGQFFIRNVFFNKNQAKVFSFGIGSKYYRFNFIHQNGYGGSSNRLVASAHYSIGKSNFSSRITLGNYRLIEGSWNDLSTLTFRLNHPFWKRLAINTEIHLLQNKYYAKDARFLVGLRYRI